ncbi:MAG: NUDIX domain-containing protein [Myxococcaceae bacterium]|nr:NUDIX domain-containing protein [Myxococcaceae bacterium]
MRIPKGLFGLAKEVLRHLLRRPVVGFVVYARTADGKVVLIRRGDTGGWALPGGTLEWGETFRAGLPRELMEEAGVTLVGEAQLLGVYSDPGRDPRFHAVTVVFGATVSAPTRPPMNPLEILEVRAFSEAELPSPLSHGLDDVLARARAGQSFWE